MTEHIHTASSLNCWLTCQQKYNYKYELGYRTSETTPAFLIGTAVHLGLEYFWKGKTINDARVAVEKHMATDPYFKREGWIEKLRIQAYIAGYYHRWLNTRDLYDVIGVELEFLEKGRAGKLDALVRRKSDGKLVIIEHKTASKFAKADEPGSTYWSKLSMDTQVCFYHRHIQQMYKEDPEILYDVIIKSKSTPLKGSARKRKAETDAEFAQRKYDYAESPGEYSARIKKVYMKEGAERYVRKTIHLTHQEANRKIDELDSVIRDIEYTHNEWNEVSEEDGYWTQRKTRIRNTTACNSYGGTCEFLGVCAGLELLDDPKFEKKEKLHSELTVKETQ